MQVFLTAYLELVMLGGLSKGQSVLIHAGASGVGQHHLLLSNSSTCTPYGQVDIVHLPITPCHAALDTACKLCQTKFDNYGEADVYASHRRSTLHDTQTLSLFLLASTLLCA